MDLLNCFHLQTIPLLNCSLQHLSHWHFYNSLTELKEINIHVFYQLCMILRQDVLYKSLNHWFMIICISYIKRPIHFLSSEYHKEMKADSACVFTAVILTQLLVSDVLFRRVKTCRIKTKGTRIFKMWRQKEVGTQFISSLSDQKSVIEAGRRCLVQTTSISLIVDEWDRCVVMLPSVSAVSLLSLFYVLVYFGQTKKLLSWYTVGMKLQNWQSVKERGRGL